MPVTTTQVADALAVTTASASNMLKKLDALGYVVHVKRQGVALTDPGRQAALEVIRHHRLLETFLATRLGMPWDEVHREAEVLEHHVSEALADRIAEALGHPERDPHGHPDPHQRGPRRADVGAHGSRSSRRARPRWSARVDDHDDALLRFLAERGLVPDARVEVVALARSAARSPCAWARTAWSMCPRPPPRPSTWSEGSDLCETRAGEDARHTL